MGFISQYLSTVEFLTLKQATMESTTSKYNHNLSDDQRDRIEFYKDLSFLKGIETNPLFKKHTPEISGSFSDYIDQLNLSSDGGLLVLSTSNHYYYEPEELSEVKTLVNMKPLNQINGIKDFLINIFSIMPQKSYFVGCFTDSKNQNWFFADSEMVVDKSDEKFDLVENGIASRNPFLNMVYNLLDIKTNRFLTKKSVNLQFELSGWKVLNMTDIKGFTYFCAQKTLIY